MKILQIGSNSIHVSSYLVAMSTDDAKNYLLTEEVCSFDGVVANEVISFRSLNPMNLFKSYRLLKNYIKSLNPDLIHIHQVNRLAYFVSKVAHVLSIPVVTTAWGSDVLLIPKKNAFFHFLVKQTLKRSKVVTADSQDMIDAMNKIVSSDKYILLQYGIDPIQPEEKQTIVFSNRLHKKLYRIDKVIDYFNEFVQLHAEWKLVIGGTGEETEALLKQVEKLNLTDKVEFVGWLQKADNAAWYAKSTFYISIPESDGTSVSVLEAMSAGCVPVVSDLPVSKEWITNGVNGVIEQLGKNPFVQAIDLDGEKCSEINQKKVQERATRAASSKRFKEIYLTLINGK
jgi:glycosyltransferase involved in cell wall biosynthesis